MGQISEILANNIRELRKAAGLTQAQLAERLGVDPITIANYEGCRRWPGTEIVASLASTLGVPESRLFLDPDAIPKPSKEDALALVAEALGLPVEGRRKPAPASDKRTSPHQNAPEAPLSEAEKLRADILAILPEIDSVSALDTVRDSLRTFVARRRAKGQNGGGLSSG